VNLKHASWSSMVINIKALSEVRLQYLGHKEPSTPVILKLSYSCFHGDSVVASLSITLHVDGTIFYVVETIEVWKIYRWIFKAPHIAMEEEGVDYIESSHMTRAECLLYPIINKMELLPSVKLGTSL